MHAATLTRRRRLADAALLVGDRVDRGHRLQASDARGGGRARSQVRTRTAPCAGDGRAQSPSGRLRAIPAGAGSARASGAIFANTCRWPVARPRTARPGGSRRSSQAELGRRGGRRALLAASRRPRQSTSAPPARSSGAAYSSTTGCGASARAMTTSFAPSPSGHSSARAQTTLAFSISAAAVSAAQELALAPLALDQPDARIRERDGERQARESRARRPGPPDRGASRTDVDLEADQRVRQMWRRAASAPESRTVVGACSSSVQHSPSTRPDSPAAPRIRPRVAAGASRSWPESFHVKRPPDGLSHRAARPRGSGRGSSPSLCVSTSPRSRRYSWTIRRSDGGIGSSSTGLPVAQRLLGRVVGIARAAAPRAARGSRRRRSRRALPTGPRGTRSAAPGAARRRSSARGGR